MEGEWLCYGGGQFNGGSMVMLQKLSLIHLVVNYSFINGHVT